MQLHSNSQFALPSRTYGHFSVVDLEMDGVPEIVVASFTDVLVFQARAVG